MMRVRAFFVRLFASFTAGRQDAELREELESHVTMDTERYIRRGLPPEEARRAALVRAGGLALAADAYQDQRGLPLVENLVKDVRYGLRVLRRAPTFTVVAIVAIGLAVGINAGFFTLVDALMLQPIRIVRPERLVKLLAVDAGGNESIRFSYPAYRTMRDHATSIEDLVAYFSTPVALRPTTASRAGAASAGLVSGNYFAAVGGHAAMGRMLAPDDERDATPVAVISDGLWRRDYALDREIIGRDIIVNGAHATIVGVATADFIGINPLVPDLWLPVTFAARIGAAPGQLDAPSNRFLFLHGRRRAGLDVHRVEAELSALVAEPAKGTGGTSARTRLVGVALLPNDSAIPLAGETALMAAPGFIVVLLVLLIACANLANLLLSRALARQREIAVRLAIGASRVRILRQLLTESFLIALAGSALGVVLARWTVRVLSASFLAAVPTTYGNIALRLDPSWRVLVYTLCLTVISVVMFGLAPALQATASDLSAVLKGDDSTFGTRIRRSRFRDALVTAQVAACLVLLAAAGTLVHSLREVADVDTGLDVRRVVDSHLGLAAAGHVPLSLATERLQLAQRVRVLDGVASTALVLAPTFTAWPLIHVSDGARREAPHGIYYNVVTPRYFDVVGQRIVAGRGFTEADSAGGAHVVILTASAARRLWPDRPAIGQSLRIESSADSVASVALVVGVAADARSGMLWDESGGAYMYFPATTGELTVLDMSLLVRTTGGTQTVERGIADAAVQVNPDAPLTTTRVTDTFALQLLPYRYAALIASGVGLLGIGLAVLGLYGVVAFAVAQRRREIAIHVAMGAAPRDILALVLRGEMRLVLRGLVIGFLLALGEAKLLGSIVIPLTPVGVGTLAALAFGLVGVALLATIAPGLSALRIAPMQVLRQE